MSIFTSELYKIGDIIKHEEYGEGKIIGINNKKLQVKFENNNEIVNIFSDFVKKIKFWKKICLKLSKKNFKIKNN